MCKRYIYLPYFVLVFGLFLSSAASADDPNLVGWWKFDETSGITAYNSATYTNGSWPAGSLHGTLNGDPQWVAGYRDGAILLDPNVGTDDYVSFPTNNFGDLINELPECTLSIWVHYNGGPGWQRFIDIGTGSNNYIYIVPQSGASTAAMRIAIVTSVGGTFWDEFDSSEGALPTGEWHHVAATISRTNATMILYLDGRVVGSKTNLEATNSVDQLGVTTNNWLGRSQYVVDEYFHGYIDDFKIFNRILTQPEIKKVGDPEKASMPIPADGSIVGQIDVTLQWDAGIYAADVNGHNVFFGTNFSDVNQGTGGTDKGFVSSASYPVTGLTAGQTYYWRIDEVNGLNTWEGDVWSFMVQPLSAYNPSPADEAEYVDVNEDLSWYPGTHAVTHDIYLGTDETTVTIANRAAPLGVLKKQNHDSNSYEPGTLQYDTTYYWRIDEVNGATIWTGDVWSFETNPYIPATDPNLVGWWKFDKGEGTVALDYSGNYNHGTIYGPNWVAGYDGNALQFAVGGDHVDLPIGTVINSLTNSTYTAWVNWAGGADWQRIFNFGSSTNVYFYLCPNSDADVTYIVITTTGGTGEQTLSGPPIGTDGWHHVAVTLDADSNTLTLYVDAVQVAENTNITLTPSDLNVTTDNWLGRSEWPNDPYFNGLMDDFRIYDYPKTQEEIELIMMRFDPLVAWKPHPPTYAIIDVLRAKPLSWSPGDMEDKHDVYFGTDVNAVADANTSDLTGIYRVRQDANNYTPPEVFPWGQTYYWRIDEYNTDTSITKGIVWNFTTADYLEIDNFDRYTTRDALREVWKDGYVLFENGSNITVSTEIDPGYPFLHTPPGPIHEGLDALQFVYDNDKSIVIYVPGYMPKPYTVSYYYSEMEANTVDLECTSDWTAEDVKMLSLQFSGDVDNDIGTYEQMYVALEDSNGNIALVKYGDSAGEDVNNLLSREWTEWAIDLQEFEDANANFDLTDVNKVYIGFGERYNNTTVGGSGVVYFDSIRLYKSRCVPAMVSASDLSDDCTTNLDDFILLADSWHDEQSTAVPIIDLNASDFNSLDRSWPNTDGTLGGQFDINAFDINDNPTSDTIDSLKAVTFDGNDYLISDFNAPGGITGANDFSFIMTVYNPTIDVEEWILTWARRGGPAGTTSGVGYGTNPAWAVVVHWNEGGEEPDMGFDGGIPAAGMWHEIAVTYDGLTEKVLVDGKLNAVEGGKILDVYADDKVVVGAGYDLDVNDANNLVMTLQYTGSVNRIRVFDEALSQAQLEYIATGKFSADLNGDGKVDFKDLAMMLDDWLKEKLFP